MHNLLEDPLIRWTDIDRQERRSSLPEVMHALTEGQVESFTALRGHQKHAWHSFLVQLATLAVRHQPDGADWPQNPDQWRAAIRRLSPEFPDDEPWQLITNDATAPAFMQPPSSNEKTWKRANKKRIKTADELDILQTSKNHDVKSAQATEAQPDDWIYSIVTRQTMGGFDGNRLYGIARMNRGLGNRPALSIAPQGGPSPHFIRDVEALLQIHPGAPEEPDSNTAPPLLWLLPWDGEETEQLHLEQLPEGYIEICRRIRLTTDDDGRLNALRATSKDSRIQAKEQKGVVGDYWTPISIKGEPKSLTVAGEGFNYRKITEYLTPQLWEAAPLMRALPSDARHGPMQLVARAMARGQGKTDGYHERTIPIRTETAIRAFGSPRGARELAELSEDRVKQAGTVGRFLRRAIATAINQGDETKKIGNDHWKQATRWAEPFEQTVDASFFEELQEEFNRPEAERHDARRGWMQNTVMPAARLCLQDALDQIANDQAEGIRTRIISEKVLEERASRNRQLRPLLRRKETQ